MDSNSFSTGKMYGNDNPSDCYDQVSECLSREGSDYLHNVVPQAPTASAEAASPKAIKKD